MASDEGSRSAIHTVATGLSMGESPRYHEGHLWVSDWGDLQIITIDSHGERHVAVGGLSSLPFCFDWLPSGPMLIVAGSDGRILRKETDQSPAAHADLTGLSRGPWNEITVDGRGNAYVNGSEGLVALVDGNGSVRKVADGLEFPNGMVVTSDNSVLIIAESHGNRLTAFDIASDGSLSHRRAWANLAGDAPDGICLDAEGAIWYADVPHRRCVRVREGGEILQTVDLDRGCFACMLGGSDGRTLFMVANEWQGMEKAAEIARARTGRVLSIPAPSPGAGWPRRTDAT